jgi:hypothetical protein
MPVRRRSPSRRALWLAACTALIACHEGDPRDVPPDRFTGAWVGGEGSGRIFFHPSGAVDDSELGLAALAGLDAGPTLTWKEIGISQESVQIEFVDPPLTVDAGATFHGVDGVVLSLPGDASVSLERTDYAVFVSDAGSQ